MVVAKKGTEAREVAAESKRARRTPPSIIKIFSDITNWAYRVLVVN